MLVGVYNDEGTSPWCVECTVATLESRGFTPFLLSATDIVNGTNDFPEKCAGLVFPGGRDTPYHEKLHGQGNANIRQFVEKGGWYLGNCAGGYYGSAHIEFCKGDPTMEILADRELGFFRGTAVGPRYPGYSYQDNTGEHVVALVMSHSTTVTSSTDKVDSTEHGANGARINCAGAQNSAPHVYFNGGCWFRPDGTDQLRSCEVLWQYNTSHNNRTPPSGGAGGSGAAVIGMTVGQGRAVLSGVHPEIGFKDLDNTLHSEKVKQAMKVFDTERQIVLDSIFDFLAGGCL